MPLDKFGHYGWFCQNALDFGKGGLALVVLFVSCIILHDLEDGFDALGQLGDKSG